MKPFNCRPHATVSLTKEHNIIVMIATLIIANASPTLVVAKTLEKAIREQFVFFAGTSAIFALGKVCLVAVALYRA